MGVTGYGLCKKILKSRSRTNIGEFTHHVYSIYLRVRVRDRVGDLVRVQSFCAVYIMTCC